MKANLLKSLTIACLLIAIIAQFGGQSVYADSPWPPSYLSVVSTWEGTVNQTQTAYAQVRIKFVGGENDSLHITHVELSAPWITLNESFKEDCACYKILRSAEIALLVFRIHPTFDTSPNYTYLVVVRVDGIVKRTGMLLVSESAAMRVTVYPADGSVVPSTESPSFPTIGIIVILACLGTVMVMLYRKRNQMASFKQNTPSER
jgi:hypothetical protein